MLLYLACGAILEIRQDKPVCLGWPGARRPTRSEWEMTKAEVERLLGYEIVVWGGPSQLHIEYILGRSGRRDYQYRLPCPEPVLP